MRKSFRDKIKQNFVQLVKELNPSPIVEHFSKENILTKEEVQKIFADDSDSRHNNRLLLFQILKKDDNVYYEFLKVLEKCQLKHLLPSRNHATMFHEAISDEISLENLNISSLVNHNKFESSDGNENSDFKTEKPIVVKVRLATDFPKCDNIYDTTSINRGQVLIINNEIFDDHDKRVGSEHDVNGLKSLFGQMNMNVEFHQDLSVKEMKDVISNFTDFDADKISDICILIIMSHGEEKDNELVVLDRKDKALETSWIEDQFTHVNCPLFENKPKIILYQLCRGQHYDYALTKSPSLNQEQYTFTTPPKTASNKTDNDLAKVGIQSDSGSVWYSQRRLGDLLVGYATSKGHRAHRDPQSGSWYIRQICEVFSREAYRKDIISMLGEVDLNLKHKVSSEYTMQTTSYASTGFNKSLYFNPGIYRDESGNLQKFV